MQRFWIILNFCGVKQRNTGLRKAIKDDIIKIQRVKNFDPITQKHYHKNLVYDYNDGNHHFCVTYSAEDIIETFVVDEGYGYARAKAGRSYGL